MCYKISFNLLPCRICIVCYFNNVMRFQFLHLGKRFYGPGGPYAAFAGRDASRGLATFSVAASDDFDDLSDLTPVQKESVKEWETQFTG